MGLEEFHILLAQHSDVYFPLNSGAEERDWRALGAMLGYKEVGTA